MIKTIILFLLVIIPILSKDNTDLFVSGQFIIHPYNYGPPLQLGLGIGTEITPYYVQRFLAPSISFNAKLNVGMTLSSDLESVSSLSINIGNHFEIMKLFNERFEIIPSIGIKEEFVRDTSFSYLMLSIKNRYIVSVGKRKMTFSPYISYDQKIFYGTYNPEIDRKELGLNTVESGACIGLLF